MKKIKSPFFCINPKSYLYGKELLELAKVANQLAKQLDITIIFTAPFSEISRIAEQTEHLIVTAQHMDGIYPGKGMGSILPEALVSAGAEAVFLNHAENPMTYQEIEQAMKRAEELNLHTIVCANSVVEAKAVALLEPSIIVCEPTELIGTGKTSDAEYMQVTNQEIKEISFNTKILQAAGISTADDVRRVLESGADGTGATSGIVCSDSPVETLKNMLTVVAQFKGGSDEI